LGDADTDRAGTVLVSDPGTTFLQRVLNGGGSSQSGIRTLAYAQAVGAVECHLVIFNRSPETGWDDKIWHQSQQVEDRKIDVWGM